MRDAGEGEVAKKKTAGSVCACGGSKSGGVNVNVIAV